MLLPTKYMSKMSKYVKIDVKGEIMHEQILLEAFLKEVTKIVHETCIKCELIRFKNLLC